MLGREEEEEEEEEEEGVLVILRAPTWFSPSRAAMLLGPCPKPAWLLCASTPGPWTVGRGRG